LWNYVSNICSGLILVFYSTIAHLHQTPVQKSKPWDNGKKIADILVAAHRNPGRAIKTGEITSKVYTFKQGKDADNSATWEGGTDVGSGSPPLSSVN